MPQAVVSDSLLQADDTCRVFQHKNVKLSVHFGQENTKSILFGTKYKLRNAKALSIVYNGTEIKQYEKVKQFVIFKALNLCFEETIGFDVKASFASCPLSRQIRWYNKRVLRKGYLVPRNFLWIKNYKLKIYWVYFRPKSVWWVNDLNVIDEVNSRLKFLHGQNRF